MNRNKRVARLAATSMMVMSMGITAMATGLESPTGLTNPAGQVTPVNYSGIGNFVYDLTVPSLLKPTESGEVKLEGTWNSTKTATVTVPEAFEMINNIDGGTKIIDVYFEDIEQVGSNTSLIEVNETIEIGEITDALFGEWNGTITYTISFSEAHQHTWDTDYTVDEEPSCTVDGSKSIHCSTCEEIKDITPIPAGHVWATDYEVDIEATCTTEGSQSIHCENCSETKDAVSIPAGHVWSTNYEVDVEPTCTTVGSQSIHCENCSEVKDVTEIPVIKHSFTGTICDECGQSIEEIGGLLDAEGNVLATWEETGIALGYDYEAGASDSKKPAIALQNYPTATKIIVPALESEKLIGSNAFQGCSQLEEIVLPSNCTWIGKQCFMNCTNLKSIVLPAGITFIPESGFLSCTSLETVEIKGNVTGFNHTAFFGCTNLKSINIPDTVTVIGTAVFADCESLEELRIPAVCTKIMSYTFQHCDSLERLVFVDPTGWKMDNISVDVSDPEVAADLAVGDHMADWSK